MTLPYVTTITIPSSRVSDVRHLLDRITEEKGGCTRTSGDGEWVDHLGVNHVEPVDIFSWHGSTHSTEFLSPVIERLLLLGEEAVLYTNNSVPAHIVTRQDYPALH